ncbi:hypothetical protein FOR84_16845 [Vibrio parahaemolyticus]|nr:hypothetical protein [Vibrio parahaemolyticus]
MSICVKVDAATQYLVSSSAIPCDGFLLLAEADVQNRITQEVVLILFGSAAGLFALVFVIRLALSQFGIIKG